jgi:hypothetical protein
METTNTFTINLSPQECDFIIKLIGQLSINPASKEASQIVEVVQSILSKFPVKD